MEIGPPPPERSPLPTRRHPMAERIRTFYQKALLTGGALAVSLTLACSAGRPQDIQGITITPTAAAKSDLAVSADEGGISPDTFKPRYQAVSREVMEREVKENRPSVEQKLKGLAKTLEQNIQPEFYPPEVKAFYGGLVNLGDQQLVDYLHEHDSSIMMNRPDYWTGIGVGPEQAVNLELRNNDIEDIMIIGNLNDIRYVVSPEGAPSVTALAFAEKLFGPGARGATESTHVEENTKLSWITAPYLAGRLLNLPEMKWKMRGDSWEGFVTEGQGWFADGRNMHIFIGHTSGQFTLFISTAALK